MFRFAVVVLIACLSFTPAAVAASKEAAAASTVVDSIFEPVEVVVAWLVEIFAPKLEIGTPEETTEFPENPEQEYGAEIVPNG